MCKATAQNMYNIKYRNGDSKSFAYTKRIDVLTHSVNAKDETYSPCDRRFRFYNDELNFPDLLLTFYNVLIALAGSDSGVRIHIPEDPPITSEREPSRNNREESYGV
jgi:hypothetical protein